MEQKMKRIAIIGLSEDEFAKFCKQYTDAFGKAEFILVDNSQALWGKSLDEIYDFDKFRLDLIARLDKPSNYYLGSNHLHFVKQNTSKVYQKTCPICGKKFKGYGNDGFPVITSKKVCDECNINVIIPARLTFQRLQNNDIR